MVILIQIGRPVSSNHVPSFVVVFWLNSIVKDAYISLQFLNVFILTSINHF